jgi:segregation and condensation protein B
MKSRNQKNNVINFPTSMSESEREIEAILFAAEEPLDIESIESKIKKKRILQNHWKIYSAIIQVEE